MSQYLDLAGVQELWSKIKTKVFSAQTAAGNYTDQEVGKIKSGTYVAAKATSADSATNATNATSATTAANVSTNINGKAISTIFESDGVTVKKATSATSATSASSATSATNATNVTTSINSKAISTIFESNGTTVKNATSASSASNVTSQINGNAITNIFESNGTTVKNATYATSAGSATKATSATSATTAGSATKATQDSDGNQINTTYIKKSLMGVASGVATLDTDGKVPSSQLPSYVDDVIEGYYYQGKFYEESAHTTLITGEAGKIYTDLSTNKTYRWGGSAYTEISASLAIGVTAGTAFSGARGLVLENSVIALRSNLDKKLTRVVTSDADNSGYISTTTFDREGTAGADMIGLIQNEVKKDSYSLTKSRIEVGMMNLRLYYENVVGGSWHSLKLTDSGIKSVYDIVGGEYDVIDASMAIPVATITALS